MSSVAKYRNKRKRAGLVRTEVYVPAEDVALVRALASSRSPDSYVAGAAALNVDRARRSEGIDVFNDDVARADATFAADTATLRAAGFDVAILRSAGGFHRAMATRDGDSVAIDWARDSAYRFFPAIADEIFGWRLHEIDLALNKCLALAGRI
jgi:hypothetical protein